MKHVSYLIVNPNGIKSVRKTKPFLEYNEIAVKVILDIPDVLFRRPHLEATIRVDPDKIQSNQITPEMVINTKEMIEEQTGAKIDFKILPIEEEIKEGE